MTIVLTLKQANEMRQLLLKIKCALLVLVLCIDKQVLSQDDWQSPCPRLFVYEIVDRRGSWDGIFNLVSKKGLGGVWFRLEFDRPILKFETTFGESVEAKNESLFLIKAPKTPLPAHTTMTVPFSVSYAERGGIAKLKAAYLNFEKICPENEEESLSTPKKNVAYGVTTPVRPESSTQRVNVFTSPPVTDPPWWNRRTTTPVSVLTTNKAIQELSIAGTDDDDDLFIGDFQFLQAQDATEMEQQCGTVVVSLLDNLNNLSNFNNFSNFTI